MTHNCYLCLEKVYINHNNYCKCKGSMIPHVSCMEDYIRKTNLKVCPNCKSYIVRKKSCYDYLYIRIIKTLIFVLLSFLAIMYYLMLIKIGDMFIKTKFFIQLVVSLLFIIFITGFIIVSLTLYNLIHRPSDLMLLEMETNQ